MALPTSGGVVGTYPDSGKPNVDPLTWRGFKWGRNGAGTPATVSYSFPPNGAAWIDDYESQEPFRNFQPFTSAQRTAAKQALAQWAEVANVQFVPVSETASNVGDIRFGNSGAVTNSDAAAWTYMPQDGELPENGDIWFDKAFDPNLQLKPGQYGFWTMLHETGHALGLDHPFDDGGSEEPVLPANLDTDQHTVMSYTSELSTRAYPSTPQILDILALQYIYGANMNTRRGNDTYKFSPTAQVNRTIWDAGGKDTLDLSNQTTNSNINLTEGSYSRFSRHAATETASLLGIAYGVTIENAKGGSGQDRMIGNAAANSLIGGAGNDDLRGKGGNDTLDGGTGADKMAGGRGTDTYRVDNNGDQVIETTGGATGGLDLVMSGKDLSLAELVNVENLTLIGSADIDATGNALANRLTGNNAANILNGLAGKDTMTGGKGDDTYVVNATGDVVNENVLNSNGGGVDTVASSVTSTLAARTNIENLSLTGSGNINGTGNALNNEITGNKGANKLDGAAGNDSLIGGSGNDWLDGGAGRDSLNGGAGRDTFAYDMLSEAGDTIAGFATGSGGDVLDLAHLLDTFGSPKDPFKGGYLSFTQSGSNTLVQVDSNGGMNNATTLATLPSVALTKSDSGNFIV